MFKYPTLLAEAEYDTRSISKWSRAHLNSEFSFSEIGFLTNQS